jgi:hypothetical protein
VRLFPSSAVFVWLVSLIGCADRSSVHTLSEGDRTIMLSQEALNCFGRAGVAFRSEIGNPTGDFNSCVSRHMDELPKKDQMQLIQTYQYHAYYQVCIRMQEFIFVNKGQVTAVKQNLKSSC